MEIKKRKSPTIKASIMYTKSNYKKKTKRNHYILKKVRNEKLVAKKELGGRYGGGKPHW